MPLVLLYGLDGVAATLPALASVCGELSSMWVLPLARVCELAAGLSTGETGTHVVL